MLYKHALALILAVSSMFVMLVVGTENALPQLTEITPTPTSIAPGTIVTDVNGFDIVYVPAGEFDMGTTEQEFKTLCEDTFKGSSKVCSDFINASKDIENFQKRRVKVASFWIDRYEVTIKAYQGCALYPNLCRPISKASNPRLDDDERKPQFGVMWYDAMFFCNRRFGRLPTEVEWEYAARGPNNLIFPWGNTYNKAYLSPNDATYPVGSIPENKSWIGAFDMAGNIAEWTEDRFFSSSRVVYGSDDTGRVIRGGSWANQTTQIATFARAYAPPDGPDSTVGFRCISSRAR
jgi:formylglycine-generating enzyme required for sulfatase activity